MDLEDIQRLPAEAEDPGSKAIAELLNSVLSGQVQAVEAVLPEEPLVSEPAAQGNTRCDATAK
jgi:hypothetical protein